MKYLLVFALSLSSSAWADGARSPAQDEIDAHSNLMLGQTITQVGQLQMQVIELKKQLEAAKTSCAAPETKK